MTRSDPKYMKEYWAKNAEQLRKKGRERYAKNRERYLAAIKAKRKANPEAARAADRAEWAKKQPHEKKAAGLRKFGLTLEQYERMLTQQDGRCAICKEIPERICVDHCHRTGAVRGLLCSGCNTALGLLKEDLLRIYALADYIKEI